MLLLLLLLLALAYYPGRGDHPAGRMSTATSLLRERYARGEIDQATYRAMRKDIIP